MGRWSSFADVTLSRRTLLASTAAATVAGVVSGCGSTTPSAPHIPAQATGDTGGRTPVRRLAAAETREGFATAGAPAVVQIVAHPDDDLFFMNPDVVQNISAGIPVTSVYVTDGGSFGVNGIPGRPTPEPDIPAYISSRQQGLRQAYALMLGARLFTPWERSVLPLPGGRTAEVNRLEYGGRTAELIFLNLRMHAKNGTRTVNLTRLWSTPGVTLPTQPAPESTVQQKYTYTRKDLIETLVFLLSRRKPTLVRTLDPDPDTQIHDERHPRGSDQHGFSDHPDHTAAGLFAWRALAEWGGRTGRGTQAPAFQTESFRGYYNQRWPKNLPPATVALKALYLNAYGGDPSWECGNASGCGDYAFGQDAVLRSMKGWARSTHRRYPNSGPKAVAGTDGALTVYGVLGTRLARWTGDLSGRQSPPEDLAGGPLAPSISVVRTKDGRDLVFALRFSALEGTAGANRREIVMLRQRSAGGAFESSWVSLGSPESRPWRTRLTGPPTAVLGSDGRVHVFARNGAKSVSSRVLGTDGEWSPWVTLPAGRIQEGLSATVDGRGLIHLFGTSANWVEHWSQRTASGDLRKGTRRFAHQPGDVPDAITAPDGSVLLGYRSVASDEVVIERLAAGRAKRWTTVAKPQMAGYGRVSLVDGRTASSGSGVMAVPAGIREDLAYDISGGRTSAVGTRAPMLTVGTAAALTVGTGTPVSVTMGLDGAPRITRLRDIRTS
ncbi:PIG-L family deacetylase [Streptomyces hydrogenans]|uniref:PIG-L family deacetylase n=1 Tax=Streptomyces hydrogenans TaxID=1873719 RepID=UPI0033BDB83B